MNTGESMLRYGPFTDNILHEHSMNQSMHGPIDGQFIMQKKWGSWPVSSLQGWALLEVNNIIITPLLNPYALPLMDHHSRKQHQFQ